MSNDCDSRPVVSSDEVVEGNHKSCIFAKSVPLTSSNEQLKCRTLMAMLCYHKPNPDKYPEKYAHLLLFRFYQFLNEGNLKLVEIYFVELRQSGVPDIINLNRQILKCRANLLTTHY